jgi:peptidyl-prolyl isomerase H (cyclophilin H)
VPTFTDGTG